MKELIELNLKNKKVIIFDMDGTLIDSIGIWNLTDQLLIKQLGNVEIDLDSIQRQRDDFLENHHETDIYLAYCAYLKAKYSFSLEPKAILELRWELSNDYLKATIDYKKNADVVLKRLKQLGKKLALATVTTKVQLAIYETENTNIITKANMLETFDYIVSKEDITHKKPHPEIYLNVLQHFNLKAEDCLVFEDSYLGVMAAKKAGIEVVNIYDSFADLDRDKINQICDYKINDYQEFLDLINTI